MGLSFESDSHPIAQNKVASLVTWSVTGQQFLARLNQLGVPLVLHVDETTGPTCFAKPKNLHVNVMTLNQQSTGQQSAVVLHELFHAVHCLLDPTSFDARKFEGGEIGQGLGGWAVSGNAEEQLAITGHCINLKTCTPELIAWLNPADQVKGFVGEKGATGNPEDRVSLGPFCENRVLRHLGMMLRDSHGKAGEAHAVPEEAKTFHFEMPRTPPTVLIKEPPVIARLRARAEAQAAKNANKK